MVPLSGRSRNSRLFDLAALPLLCCVAVGAPQAGESPRETYQQAMSLMQQGDWKRAAALLQDVVQAMPGNARLHNALGIALSSGGDRDAAAVQFERALELEPDYASALKNMALHQMSSASPSAAQPYLEKLLASSSDTPFAHVGLAEIAFAKGEFAAAASHFSQGGDLVAKNPGPLIKYGHSLAQTGQRPKAVIALQKVPATAPKEIHYQAGLQLAALEAFESAALAFERAAGGSTDAYELGFNLVLAYDRSGQPERAVGAGEALAAKGYRTAELRNLLSRAYEASGDTQSAYDALREATEIEPESEANYIDLIALCLDHENFDLGLEIADIAVDRVPRSHRIHLQRGVALAMKGRFDDAEDAFSESSSLAPDRNLPGVALGLILMQQDRLPDAIRVLRRRRSQAKDDYMVHWFLAEALQRSGVEPRSPEEAEAIGALRTSIKLRPDLFQSRLLMGKLLARQGNLGEAIDHLERAREIDPADVSATYQLALVYRSAGDSARAKELLAVVGKQKAQDREQFTKGGLLRIVREGTP